MRGLSRAARLHDSRLAPSGTTRTVDGVPTAGSRFLCLGPCH